MPAHANFLTATELKAETDNSLLAIMKGIGGYVTGTRHMAAVEYTSRHPKLQWEGGPTVEIKGNVLNPENRYAGKRIEPFFTVQWDDTTESDTLTIQGFINGLVGDSFRVVA